MASLLMGRRKHSIYILLTALTSVVSLAIVCTSIATPKWIDATANPKNSSNVTVYRSNVNYGLFKGTLTRRLLDSPVEYKLFFTCIWSENACAWSCQRIKTMRENEVQDLLDGNTPGFSCLPYSNKRNSVHFVSSARSNGTNNNRIFTNGGLWVSTLVFLAITILALVISLILSILNWIKSPIETYLNIRGIYVANGVALFANILAMIMYGVCYDLYIKKDISIYDTIVGDFSSEAQLSYSYWILIVPCAFHALGIFLIAMREILLNKDQSETNIDVVADAPATGVLF